MRVFDETKTLPMPRRKIVTVPNATRPRAWVTEGPEGNQTAADSQLRKQASAVATTPLTGKAAVEPIAGKPGAIAATSINLNIKLDPSRFLETSREIGQRGFQLAIQTADLSLRAALNPKNVRKALSTIEEYGPAGVALTLHGQLGPRNTVESAGLSVMAKTQKA